MSKSTNILWPSDEPVSGPAGKEIYNILLNKCFGLLDKSVLHFVSTNGLSTDNSFTKVGVDGGAGHGLQSLHLSSCGNEKSLQRKNLTVI